MKMGTHLVISQEQCQQSEPLEDKSSPLTSHRSKAYTFSCSILIGGRPSSSGAGTPKDSFDPLYVRFVRPPLRHILFMKSKTHPPVIPSRSPCLNAGLTMSSPFEFGRMPRLERDFSASRYGLLYAQYIETMHVVHE